MDGVVLLRSRSCAWLCLSSRHGFEFQFEPPGRCPAPYRLPAVAVVDSCLTTNRPVIKIASGCFWHAGLSIKERRSLGRGLSAAQVMCKMQTMLIRLRLVPLRRQVHHPRRSLAPLRRWGGRMPAATSKPWLQGSATWEPRSRALTALVILFHCAERSPANVRETCKVHRAFPKAHSWLGTTAPAEMGVANPELSPVLRRCRRQLYPPKKPITPALPQARRVMPSLAGPSCSAADRAC